MRSLPKTTTDFLVIGQGVSGMMCSWMLAREGADVTVIGHGTSTSEMSTGCVSFAGTDVLSGLGIDQPEIDSAIETVEDLFSSMMDKAGLPYSGSSGRPTTLLSHVGREVEVNLAQVHTFLGSSTMLSDCDVQALGIVGIRDLDAHLFSRMASASIGKSVRSATVHIEGLSESDIGPGGVAIRSMHAFDRLSSAIRGCDADTVILPPLFDLGHHNDGLDALQRETGRTLIEPVTPLSLPGQRLSEALEGAVLDSSVRMMGGRKLLSMRYERNMAIEAVVSSGLRQQVIEASMFIDCAGGVVSGGLDISGRDVMSSMGLDVACGPSSKVPTGLLDRAMGCGVKVSQDMHAFSNGRKLSNVLAAGSCLPGMSFSAGGGMGASMASAYLAARYAMEGGH